MAAFSVLSETETKALLQKALKESFPGVRFSVKKNGYQRIKISWSGGPSYDAVDKIIAWFELPCQDCESNRYEISESRTMLAGSSFITEFYNIRLLPEAEGSQEAIKSETMRTLVKWDGIEDLELFRDRIFSQLESQALSEAIATPSKRSAARSL